MKAAIQHTPSLEPLSHVLSQVGFECAPWTIEEVPAQQVVKEFGPDLVICSTNMPPQSLEFLMGAQNILKVFIGDQKVEGTICVSGNREADPDILMTPVADINLFKPGQFDETLKSDVVYLGPPSNESAKLVHEYGTTDRNVKIFCKQPWPFFFYCGYLDPIRFRDALASAKVCPIFDYNFDCLNVVTAGGNLMISNIPEDSIIPKELRFTDLSEVTPLIDTYKDEKGEVLEDFRAEVLKNHTWYDFTSKLLTRIGAKNTAEKCQTLKKTLIAS